MHSSSVYYFKMFFLCVSHFFINAHSFLIKIWLQKNRFNNLQDMVTLHNDNGNWKNALKTYDTRKNKRERK